MHASEITPKKHKHWVFEKPRFCTVKPRKRRNARCFRPGHTLAKKWPVLEANRQSTPTSIDRIWHIPKISKRNQTLQYSHVPAFFAGPLSPLTRLDNCCARMHRSYMWSLAHLHKTTLKKNRRYDESPPHPSPPRTPHPPHPTHPQPPQPPFYLKGGGG